MAPCKMLSQSLLRLKTQRRALSSSSLAAAKTLAGMTKKAMEVEEDPKILMTHCAGLNILNTGTKGHPKLIADSECPDWLWDIDCSQKVAKLSDFHAESPKFWSLAIKKVSMRNEKLKKCRSQIAKRAEDLPISSESKRKAAKRNQQLK